VVDCGGLENRWGATSPGFESLSLRHLEGCKIYKEIAMPGFWGSKEDLQAKYIYEYQTVSNNIEAINYSVHSFIHPKKSVQPQKEWIDTQFQRYLNAHEYDFELDIVHDPVANTTTHNFKFKIELSQEQTTAFKNAYEQFITEFHQSEEWVISCFCC
jgi:hypothetical protein